MPTEPESRVAVTRHTGDALRARLPALTAYVARRAPQPCSRDPRWLLVLQEALGHEPHLLEAHRGEDPVGFLPLAYVSGMLFGRFLVSLPYLNYGGVFADDPAVGPALIDDAIRLADELEVRHLELRHEAAVEHPGLPARLTSKVHMRLPLPSSKAQLWEGLDPKVRNQVRKGQKHDLVVDWGGEELLPAFHDVFSLNMRDLGTPVYGRSLFQSILRTFADRAEFCVVRQGSLPIAAALLLHGWGITEVPSASSLRDFNATNANMLMYWRLLERSIERGQSVFDFGRSTIGSGTHRFKEQWGAQPHGAVWQYHVRQGSVGDMRPDNPSYQRLIALWRKLPVGLTRLIGPWIVRGIP